MTPSALPTEDRKIKMDADLEAAIEGLLKGLKGDELTAAQGAVTKIYRSAVVGSFGVLVDAYSEAIDEALAQVRAAAKSQTELVGA